MKLLKSLRLILIDKSFKMEHHLYGGNCGMKDTSKRPIVLSKLWSKIEAILFIYEALEDEVLIIFSMNH